MGMIREKWLERHEDDLEVFDAGDKDLELDWSKIDELVELFKTHTALDALRKVYGERLEVPE